MAVLKVWDDEAKRYVGIRTIVGEKGDAPVRGVDYWTEDDKEEIIQELAENLPSSLPASDVSEWAKQPSKPSYTATEVGARPDTWTPTALDVGARPNTWVPSASDVGARPNTWTPNATEVGAIPSTLKGANNGVAELDDSGKVPQSQLPSNIGSNEQVQSDWNQNDSAANDYIKNRPGGYDTAGVVLFNGDIETEVHSAGGGSSSGGDNTGETVKLKSTATKTLSSASNSISFNVEGEVRNFILSATANVSGSSGGNIAIAWTDTNGIKASVMKSGTSSLVSSGISSSYVNGVFTITTTSGTFAATTYELTYAYKTAAEANQYSRTDVGSGVTSISFSNVTEEPDWFVVQIQTDVGTSNGYSRAIAVAYDKDHNPNVFGFDETNALNYRSSWTVSYSGTTLTITSQGTNNGGYFHSPATYILQTFKAAEEIVGGATEGEDEGNGVAIGSDESRVNLETGNEYFITFDEEDYICVARRYSYFSSNDSVIIGNDALVAGQSNTGEPFALWASGDYIYFATETAGVHAIKIAQEGAVKFDLKYLPMDKIASLDVDGKVPTSQLPDGFGLTLGTTNSTAFRGDYGQIAYQHSQAAHAPSNAQKNVQSDWSAASGDAAILNKPTSMPASDVSDWAKAATKPSYTASEVGAIAASARGAANGIASLGSNSKIPVAQLPISVSGETLVIG